VEQTLESSLVVGQKLYEYIEDKNEFFAKRAAFQIDSRKLLKKGNEQKLTRYSQVIQRAFNRHAVEIYTPDAKRISLSLANELETLHFGLLTSNDLTTHIKGRFSHTISQTMEEGELLRTIAAIPFESDPKEARAFIVITTLVSLELSENLQAIVKGMEEYHQLKLAKKPAQITYYIYLSVVALLVVFCAIWFGFQLAKSITIPIMKFAEGTQRVSDGDLNYQIDFETDDEIGTLIKSFNSMTKQLATGREQIALSGKMLRQQNAALEKSRKYMEIVLKNISAGVISIDNRGYITTINKAAESLLDINGRDVLNRNFKDVLKNDYLQIATKIYDQVSHGQEMIEIPLSATISGTQKHFALNFNILKDDLDKNIGAVLVFDDVTELEKAQRIAAWREVARRIAHEVKNPLTPIKLSAQRLKRKYGKTLKDVLTRLQQIDGELAGLGNLEEQIAKYERDIAKTHKDLARVCRNLSQKRKKAAKDFAKSIETELAMLKMEGTRFEIKITGTPATDDTNPFLTVDNKVANDTGIDRAEFRIAPNVGEKMKAY